MQNVTVVFKSGGSLTFKAGDDSKLLTSTDEENFGQLVGYEFEKIGTKTSAIYLDIKEVAGISVIGDTTFTIPDVPEDAPLITPTV